MCQPFGPMSHKMLLSGAFDPGRGCASPSGLCSHKDCYIPGPSTPAEGVPALRAYGPQDAIYRGLLGHFQACGKQIHNFPLFLFDVTKGVTALFENTINPRLVC